MVRPNMSNVIVIDDAYGVFRYSKESKLNIVKEVYKDNVVVNITDLFNVAATYAKATGHKEVCRGNEKFYPNEMYDFVRRNYVTYTGATIVVPVASLRNNTEDNHIKRDLFNGRFGDNVTVLEIKTSKRLAIRDLCRKAIESFDMELEEAEDAGDWDLVTELDLIRSDKVKYNRYLDKYIQYWKKHGEKYPVPTGVLNKYSIAEFCELDYVTDDDIAHIELLTQDLRLKTDVLGDIQKYHLESYEMEYYSKAHTAFQTLSSNTIDGIDIGYNKEVIPRYSNYTISMHNRNMTKSSADKLIELWNAYLEYEGLGILDDPGTGVCPCCGKTVHIKAHSYCAYCYYEFESDEEVSELIEAAGWTDDATYHMDYYSNPDWCSGRINTETEDIDLYSDDAESDMYSDDIEVDPEEE